MILKSEEVTRFMHNVARLSARYEDDPKFLQNLNRWYDCRKKLIDVTNWAADELDNLQLITNVARCTGSFVELLRSFNLGVFQQIRSSLTEYASGISIPFGALTECVFELFSHFGYMGFGSSFLATIRSQMIINEVIIAMRKDKKMFKPLKEWFRETKEFDDFVKKLFPYGISLESLLAIDDALKYNQEEAKIFAAMFFSNVGRNPSLFTNLNFITEAYLFCKSGAGKEWYKRMINIGNPADQESAYLYLRNELLALEENRSSDSDAVVEIGKLQIKSSTLGRYALIGLNGFHVYQCSSMLLSGSKHKFSSRLRELSENAQSFRKSMKKIRDRFS
ncbi:uncharacterized protein CEXT_59841 [Caerostris extrusa]|uniref:Uncharacterized protein n=1 Tax=Caerostris extrusa TaxID=172846 RepID=A0AAV4XT96_CAEEX|nr:uncharacterized protein CEXT_59841 [Caerostris extrusa]